MTFNTPAASKPEFSLPKSHEAFLRANRVIPGGVNSPARAFGAVGGEPPFMAKAEGAFLQDIDGHQYIDYIGSWGPLILGHAHPRVRAAVVEAMDLGSSFGAPTVREIDIAETVAAAVPSIEKVRFVSSGTEAAMSAVRVARGVTGRDKIIKMTGHYHGHIDALLVQAGSAATTLGTPNSPGVTAGATQDTLLCRFNDASAVADLLDHHRGQVAAVLLEPIAGNMGLVPPRPGYLETLRELTEKHGALLVFDEVMTGFRVAYSGAQARYGVTPDLTALGKIIGGGLPAAAYGASARIMDQVSPAGPIYQAGTLSGNPLAMAAGLTTLRLLRDEPPYERLEALFGPAGRGPATGRHRRQGSACRPARGQHADSVLPRRSRAQLRGSQAERHPAFRPLLLGNARPRRLPALQPVRGRLRLCRAHRGRHRPDGRGRPRIAASGRGIRGHPVAVLYIGKKSGRAGPPAASILQL